MLTGVGVYFSRRQTNLDEYFLARQSMAWLPVGLSLMAALDSAIDYLMQPSSTIKYGLILLVGTSSWLFLYPWVAHVTLPFYRRLNYFTAYEYLEARFDVRVRTPGGRHLHRLAPGLDGDGDLRAVPGDQRRDRRADSARPTVFVLGCIVTLYTALGGVQAVIWNDVMQFCVRFGGLTAVVAIAAASVPGGLGEIWRVADAAGKTTLIAPIAGSTGGMLAQVQAFFEQPLNIVAIMFALLVGRMAAYVGDQIMVQRLQTTKSLEDARKAFIVNAAGDIIWMFALSFVGLALFAYFQLPRAAARFRDRQDPAVFHVADVSARHRRPRDRVDHGVVAVERRLRDQLVHVGRRHRLLQPAVARPPDRPRTLDARAAARGGGVAGGDGRLRRGRARCWRSTCRGSAACSRSRTS